eukprot:g2814.t1
MTLGLGVAIAAALIVLGGLISRAYVLCAKNVNDAAIRKRNLVLVWGFLIRVVGILYGEWHDRHVVVKYTDVDYKVFSDAANLVAEGKSPYERATYRYSPLLAFVLVPNVLFAAWGKLVFGLADVGIGVLISKILRKRGVSDRRSWTFVAIWVLNPLTINMSTRGSGDALIGIQVLGVIYLLLTDRVFAAGALYGVAVHFRIYPAIYAPALFLFVGRDSSVDVSFWRLIFGMGPRRFRQWKLAATSAASFALLTITMTAMYGSQFLDECYFYHLRRADTRHNFSVYFYSIYLGTHRNAESSLLIGLAAFAPQAIALSGISLHLYRDLCLCLFSLTAAFVAFNKVCTAQYFVWYVVLLPLILPFSRLTLRYRGLAMLLAWFLSESHWLYWGYRLEFEGESVFFEMWIAGMIFFSVNIMILAEFIRHADGARQVEKTKMKAQ